MKKVFLSLAVLATIALASCDGKKANDSESANITVADETIEAQIDSVANEVTEVAEVTEEANDMKDVENALSEAEQHLNDAKDAANAIHDVSKQIEAAHDAAEAVLNNL